jgi:hypothetical protein
MWTRLDQYAIVVIPIKVKLIAGQRQKAVVLQFPVVTENVMIRIGQYAVALAFIQGFKLRGRSSPRRNKSSDSEDLLYKGPYPAIDIFYPYAALF